MEIIYKLEESWEKKKAAMRTASSSTITSPASRGVASVPTGYAGRVRGGRTGNALETLLDAEVTCARHAGERGGQAGPGTTLGSTGTRERGRGVVYFNLNAKWLATIVQSFACEPVR